MVESPTLAKNIRFFNMKHTDAVVPNVLSPLCLLHFQGATKEEQYIIIHSILIVQSRVWVPIGGSMLIPRTEFEQS